MGGTYYSMKILGKTNQTLRGHIQDCLTVCDEIIARREPFLRQLCQRFGWNWEKVRHALRFAVWCHDIGKASDEWQDYIRNKGSRITHALPSFGIGLMTRRAPKVFDRSPVYASMLAVLAHHGQLHKDAFKENNFRWQDVTFPTKYLNKHFDFFQHLEPDIHLNSWDIDSLSLSLDRMCAPINMLKREIKGKENLEFKVLYSLILNVLTASDGYASGHSPKGGNLRKPKTTNLRREKLSDIENEFPLYRNESLKALPFVSSPNNMQQCILQQDSERIILNAGCGEGKTAAALLFAQKLLKANRIDRIIFTLPTKFTANNLMKDLTDIEKYKIPEDIVGITHGDASEFLRQREHETKEQDIDEDEIQNLIMAQVFENSIYAKPITISTVDHLIMSLYHGYKFADRAFSNVVSSLVVFDEVHYYEKHTMGAIAETMRRLNRITCSTSGDDRHNPECCSTGVRYIGCKSTL